MDILIRKQGTLIDVSLDGRTPLPEPIARSLQPALAYEHKRLLRGHDQYDNTGHRSNMEITTRHLFRMEQGRLTTGYGYIPRITQLLQAQGHRVLFQDITPPRPRPNCYVPNWENLWRNFQPRPMQPECLAAIAGSWGGVINATMGFGKTHLFTAIAHLYPIAKIAVVVKPKDVAARIVRQLTAKFPNVGQVGGGKRRLGDRITVFTAGSTHHAENEDFDILLCDEGHQLMSESLSDHLGLAFVNTRNFTFSATPHGRLDGAGAKLEMFFGPEIFRLTYQEAVELGLVVPIHVRWLKLDSTVNPAKDKTGVSAFRWGIWRNEARHALIAQDIRTRYTNNEQILISVATLDHAIRLWRHLPEFELAYAGMEEEDMDSLKQSGLLPPNFTPMTTARREAMRTAFEEGTLRRVIATDVWSTGVDFEQLQVLYRADARESEILDSQWGGRTSRICEATGKAASEIIDIVDCWDKNFKRKSEARRRHYKRHGWSEDWPMSRRQIGHV